MVVIRESPRKQHSPDQNKTQWPPKSPFQALLSSPSGRKKWEDSRNFRGHRTPSPSPVKSSSRVLQLSQDDTDMSEEEDEETLKLQLQHIEAKLKLKALQKSKKSAVSDTDGEGVNDIRTRPTTQHDPFESLAKPERQPAQASDRHIEIPVSPTREQRALQEPVSPARRRLGLTSNPRAEDVSLKRARDGTFVKRSNSGNSLEGMQPRLKSFNERLAERKVTADERQARKDRLDRVRSIGFSGSSKNLNLTARSEIADTRSVNRDSTQTIHGTRALKDTSHGSGNAACRSKSIVPPREEASIQLSSKEPTTLSRFRDASPRNDTNPSSTEESREATPGYDTFSDIHLSKRHISHSVVAREMAGKEVYPLTRLLKEVKSPEYDPPDCESDYVVFAVLASKSEPLDQAQTHRIAEKHSKDNLDAPRNKFMVLRLCDLEWEIDCYLFGTAFKQFWKLTPGTLLAILNPAILPPKGNRHNGQFSLKLGSSEDCVMEIGVARDLGYCSSVKKDGQACGAWIDKRKTEACEFHITMLVDRQRKHRMEVNTMWRGIGNSEPHTKSRTVRNPPRKQAGVYHHEYGQLFTVSSAMGKSAATLLDAEDTDALHNMTQAEASRKRIAAAQKERDLAKQLAGMGNSMGAEYLRASNPSARGTWSNPGQDPATDARHALFSKPSAAELGLLSNRATDIRLSPAKDRKRHFGLGALSATTGGRAAMGWGGAKKYGLLLTKEDRAGSPEKGQSRLDGDRLSGFVRPRSQESSIRSTDSTSPRRKRARFALEKGIREPGRESLPGDGMTTAGGDRDEEGEDDDELDIV